VVDLSEAAHIERELMLIKVRAMGKDRGEMKRMSEIFRAALSTYRETPISNRAHRHRGQARCLHSGARGGAPSETVANRCLGDRRGERVLKFERADHRAKGNSMKVYYDKDADLSLVKGKKVTIVGLRLAGARPLPEPARLGCESHRRIAPRRRLLGQGREGRLNVRRSPMGSRAPTSS